MKNNLADGYVIELFSCAFRQNNFFEVLLEHLKYSYLTHEHEKKFWKKAVQHYTLNGKVPSLGIMQVEFRKEEKVKDFIYELRIMDDFDENATIEAFQDFIKESKFVELFESSGELYNRGDQDGAYKTFIVGAEELSKFSIKEKLFDKVFENFEQRQLVRLTDDSPRRKVPFCIEQLDDASRGGPETGETVLLMAESGVGKSQFLAHYSVQTSRRQRKVALIQIEGTKRQVMDRLDAAWTGALYHDIKKGEIEADRYKKLKNILRKIKGEIFVEAYEKFGGATINNIRSTIKDLKRLHGDELDLVCIDYLELVEVGDGIVYGPNNERHRQQKIGRAFKEIAMEFDVVVATVTQAMNLPSELKKDVNFCMTREYLSEDKGKIRPFDFFFTLNQSYDEMRFLDKKGNPCPRVRIYIDKMREYASGQVVKLVTNFSRSRFYDRRKTLEYIIDFEDEE